MPSWRAVIIGGVTDIAGEIARQLKQDGHQCFVWDCPEPDPKFPVTWKCATGHRDTLWYCRGHIGLFTAMALEAAREENSVPVTGTAP